MKELNISVACFYLSQERSILGLFIIDWQILPVTSQSPNSGLLVGKEEKGPLCLMVLPPQEEYTLKQYILFQ